MGLIGGWIYPKAHTRGSHANAHAPHVGETTTDSALVYVKSSAPVHDWPGHPETYERLGSIERTLEQTGLGTHARVRQLTGVAPATLEDVCVIHDPRYLAALEEKTKGAIDVSGLMVDESTYITRSSYVDAMQGAGAVKAVVDAIMESRKDEDLSKTTERSFPAGFALSRPPGHHCTKNRPMGFCILNNAAIAARYIQSTYHLKKIAIFDFDVHHGNGTQDLFYSDPDVLFMSIHQDGSFPGTGKIHEIGLADGQATTLNLPLPGDSGHMAALQAFEEVILPKLRAFGPDFLIVSAGYDAHVLDPLGGLQYTGTTYYTLTENIMNAAKDLCGGRCLFVLEGGYNLDALGESVASTFSAILDGNGPIDSVRPDWLREEPRDDISKIISEVKSIHELDINDVLLCLGYGLNTVVSKGLKEIIRQPRPDYGCESLGNCHEYGMPSNHAQFMAFCFSVTLLSYLAKKKVVAARGTRAGFADRLVTSKMFAMEISLLGISSVIISWARVYLGYHTLLQVLVGYMLGVVCALAWWSLTGNLHSQGILDAACEALYTWCGIPIHNDTNNAWWPIDKHNKEE